MRVRVSEASAVLLGLKQGKISVSPGLIYLMLDGRCSGSCKFCSYANGGTGRLARVRWPEFELDEIRRHYDGEKRICIQLLRRPNCFEDLFEILEKLEPESASISTFPSRSQIKIDRLREHGVDSIGVGLDCANIQIFKLMKGFDGYNEYINWIEEASPQIDLTVHLIVGLGESDEDVLSTIQRLHDLGARLALFPLEPEVNSTLEKPGLPRYRAIQMAEWLISNDRTSVRDLEFKEKRLVSIFDRVERGAFLTRGCRDCNRPFYTCNQRKIYNYPRELSDTEFKKAIWEAGEYMKNYKENVFV